MSNNNNSNRNSAQIGTNPTFQHQQGITLMNQNPLSPNPYMISPQQVASPKPPLYKQQCLTDRGVSPPPQFTQNKPNFVQGGALSNLNNPAVLPHQLAISPKPSIGNLPYQALKSAVNEAGNYKEQSNVPLNNSSHGQFQVVSVTSRNISPQPNHQRQQRFYSPTPATIKEGSTVNDQQQNRIVYPNQATALYSGNLQMNQPGFIHNQQQIQQFQTPRYPISIPSSNSGSKQTTQNSERGPLQSANVLSSPKPLGEKQIISNQQQTQRFASPTHGMNPVMKPIINASPANQGAVQVLQKGPNFHLRSQTTTIQNATNLIQNNQSPPKNIVTILPQSIAYTSTKPVENNNLNNSSLGSLQKYNISENLTGSQNQQVLQSAISQDLTRSNNAKIVQVNQQSKGYIISNLINSQSSPIKSIIKVNNQPLQEKNVSSAQQQQNLKNIDSTHLSPEAKKLYEMIGKYNSVVNDNKPPQNNENKLNTNQTQGQVNNSSQVVARSLTPNDRFSFGQRELKVVQPVVAQVIYPQTRVIPTSVITTTAAALPVTVIPNASIVEVQKPIATPVSHSLEARRKISTHKSLHSSRSVSVDENRNDLSIVIEVNSASKNRRFIEGSPVRSKSPAVVQGSQVMIQNSPAVRLTHYYKKGNKTLTLEEVMEDKKKAAELLAQSQVNSSQPYQSQLNQQDQPSHSKFNNISPLKYDRIEEERDEVLQPDEYNTDQTKTDYLGLIKNNLYSSESNNAYSTNQPSTSGYNTNQYSSKLSKPPTREQIEFDREQNKIQQQQEQLLKQQRDTLEQQKILIQQAERKASQDLNDSLLKESQLREVQLREQLERQQRELMQKMKAQQEEFQRSFQIEQERRSSNDSQFLKESQYKEQQLKDQLERQQQEYLFKMQKEQFEFQKNLMAQQVEQKSLLESQILKESQVKEMKLKEQVERQQLEMQQQQLKYQEEKLRLEREQQELQRNLMNQAKELEKIKLTIEQDKKKEMEEQIKRQQLDQQKQFDMMSQQQQDLIKKEQEIQRQKEIEQQKQVEQQQQQFQQMLLAQQQMSAEERKQFREIYAQQQEELKRVQQQQLEQQKLFAEQLQSTVQSHNKQLDNLRQEQDAQTRELKDMLLNQSRSQGSPTNDSYILHEKLREEKEQIMRQQMDQALQLERQKQELKEREFKMMQEQQQLLIQQQSQQLEQLRRKQSEQEHQQQSLIEQKKQLENQFNEFRNRNDSSQMQSYEAGNSDQVLNSDRYEVQIQNNYTKYEQNNRREAEVTRAIEVPQGQEEGEEDEEVQQQKLQQQVHFKETIKPNRQAQQQQNQQASQQANSSANQQPKQQTGVQEIAELYKDLEDQGFVITDQNWQTQKRTNQQGVQQDKKNKITSKQGYKTQEAEEEINEQTQQIQQQQYSDRNKYTNNQGNGDYINLYSSSNNSQQKQNSDEDDDQKQRNQQEEYEETYSVDVDEEEQNQKYQNQQVRVAGQASSQSKSAKSNKNVQLAEQLDEIEQEIQRLQQEEQQARNFNKKNVQGNQKIKNVYQRNGVVPEENEEDYHSNSLQKKKKQVKNQQIIYANPEEKRQKGGQKVYKNNQVEKAATYVPGQRLYEYALEKTRRKEALKQQSDIEKQQKEIEQCTFNPRLISTNRQFDEFHQRNDRWLKQKEMNIDQKFNFEKEKEVRECTFHPEFYTPNKFSSQYTNISNDPTSLYKRQMEWKGRVEADIQNQKEVNDIMIKERSNEIFNSGKMRSTMMNSPQRDSEYEAVASNGYSSRLNKILYSCRNRNSANFNEEGHSAEQNSYQQYNQQNQNYGYAYGRNYEQQEFQGNQLNQNNGDKGDNLMKSSNIDPNFDIVGHIQGIMRQSNYCDQNIELEQMLSQQNKQQQKSLYGNNSSEKRQASSNKKDYQKISQQGSEFIINKEEIKQKEVDRLRDELLQNKPIVVTKHPILAERKEYAQVIGNITVQKNKYVLAWQTDPNMNQPQHYVNFSFDNQQQQNENLIEQYQNAQLNQQLQQQQQLQLQNEQQQQLQQQQQQQQLQQQQQQQNMVIHQHSEVVHQEQSQQLEGSTVYQYQRQVLYHQSSNEGERRVQISKTQNDEIEELVTHEHQNEMYSLPNNQTENYERAVQETDGSEII